MSDAEEVAGWEHVASAWERNRERTFEAFRTSSEWLLRHAAITEGATVLELAAGPGETGFVAAEMVGATGRVISTDIAPSMVEAARRGARARGLQNFEARVMDAQALDLEDATVDAVISRLGMMLVPDPGRALAEVRRVLRPGRRLAYTTIGGPDRNQWMSVMMGALLQHGHQPAGGNPFEFGGPFSLSTPERNEELLTAAGFVDAHAEVLDGSFEFDGPDDYWDVQTSLAEPIRAAVAALDGDEIASVRSTVAELLEPFRTDAGRLRLPTQVVVSGATAP